MSTYVWCEDSGSGYAFWNTVFKIMYPEFIVETKNSNTRLNKAIRQISDDNHGADRQMDCLLAHSKDI